MTMAADPGRGVVGRRTLMAAVGALAGLAGWFLIEELPGLVDGERLVLFLTAAAGAFFFALLAASGALAMRAALAVSALVSVGPAALLTWASLRYDAVDDFLATGHPLVAFGLVVCLSLPFLVVAFRPEERWRSYPALFRQSWDIAVRYAAAWIFTGAFWVVLYLSDALLDLVGLEIIRDILDIEVMPPVLTGAALGLALAVVAELADYISPFLILRLLRLLMPVVLLVTLVFLGALPFRGLSALFGGLSAAAVLLAMGVGIATLITAVIDREDAEAASTGVLRLSAQVLALTLPLLSGLALYAVWLRVADYGWSPDRVAAACAGAVGMGYGVLYSAAVVVRRDWMERVRRANIAMALAVIALAALWLTPLLNAEAVSARSQVSRYASGKVPAEALDLWFIGRDLGRAGDAALDRLRAAGDGDDELAERMARLETAANRWDFESADRETTATETANGLLAEILATVAVVPSDRSLDPALLAGAALPQLRTWQAACRRNTPGGNPGCVVMFADLLPDSAGDEAVLFTMNAAGVVSLNALDAENFSALRYLRGVPADLSAATLDRVIDGDVAITQPALRSLDLGGVEVLILP